MDMKRSDLPLLISLDALLDTLNVTRAARRLSISQPALSGQLSRLRELFEDPLLVPSEQGRGMAPTPRALEIQPRLSQALITLRSAVSTQSEFDPATAQRTFVVATNDSVFTIIGVAALSTMLAQEAPGLRISFVSPPRDDLIARLERGEIDLYIGAFEKVPEALKARFLLRDGFRMAQGKHHERGTRNASLDDYCNLRHIMVSQEGNFSSPVDDALAALSKTRKVVVTVSSYNQVALVLSSTHCVATLPSRLLQKYSALLDILPLPFTMPPFEIAMAWHPSAQHDAGHQWLRDQFAAMAAEAEAEAETE